MIKYFCDKCKVELSAEEVRFSLDMIGKELCSKHAHAVINSQKKTRTRYVQENVTAQNPFCVPIPPGQNDDGY